MTIVNVYLTFDGNCKEAFDFYKENFSGDFSYLGTFADMPPEEGKEPVPKKMKNRIMHISLPISKETMLMGSDTGGEWGSSGELKVGNNFSISVNTESKKEADRLFKGLSADGKVTMPMAKTFWGDYFGMCEDKFGINWMFSFNEGQNK